MGAGLFSDDLALDVRGAWEDHLNKTGDGGAATRHTRKAFPSSIEDPDERATVWIALALTQWKWERLEKAVRDRAIELIESGDGLQRWEGGAPRQAPGRAGTGSRGAHLDPAATETNPQAPAGEHSA